MTEQEQNTFKGQEYLGLYPYVDFVPTSVSKKEAMFANRAYDTYAHFDSWLAGTEKIRKRK